MHAGPAARLTVRLARLGDEDALLEIDQATWSPLSSPSPEPSPGPFFNERTLPENVVVAESDGRVVGWAKFEHPTPLRSSRHVWHITGLGVDPDHQGRGVGYALMEALIAEARARGGLRMTLRVFGSNEPAQRLYKRLGFEVEGVLRGEFRVGGGEFVDDLFMARDLTG